VKAWTFALALALGVGAPSAAVGQQPVNPMHPAFVPRDAAGNPTRVAADVSATNTCGGCHDAPYIESHSSHGAGRGGATCVHCHVDGGRLDVAPERLDDEGRLVRHSLRIGAPRPASCAPCHGVVSEGRGLVELPSSLVAPGAGFAARGLSLTLVEGAIVAPQRMSESFLDLQDKGSLTDPWDVHAAKLVECTSCHFAANDPARVDDKRTSLRYVKADPRRMSTAEFLQRPDHRLATPGCRSCHDALATHDFLPYRERHMEVLGCQTCHISAPRAPAAEMVDATVCTPEGEPVVRYRNMDPAPGEANNAAFVRPLRPLLVERVESDGARRLAPVNLVSRYRWVVGAEAVPADKVAAALLDGGRYAPAVLAELDVDHDGRLDARELRLDTPAKAALVAARLRPLVHGDPTIEGTLEAHPLAHGVGGRHRAERACEACHAATSRLSGAFPIVPYLPGGVAPRPRDGDRVTLEGAIVPTPEGGLAFQHGPTPGRLHVLGATRHALSNRLGFFLFLAVALGVTAHGAGRVLLRGKRAGHAHAAPPSDAPKVYVFGVYERLWHWTMAASGVVLIGTGIGIHNAGASWVGGLPRLVLLHNVAAVVLSANAFLSLFYHLATIAIRSFIPEPTGFVKRVLEHVAYQSRGIFHGAPHPTQAPTEKLNPLQQVTYLALLNLLFPLQIATGVLLWAIGRWPDLGAALGGLSIVAPVHNLGAWLFLSFFVLHVYLVTTGRSVGDHLQSMLTGYRAVEPEEQTP
jgi:thiosulfate reductase cytochrome b subunit